jgi:hypothetical protein
MDSEDLLFDLWVAAISKDALVQAIEDAIDEYGIYHVDIYVEEGKVFLMYHSSRDSFPITDAICTTYNIDLRELAQIADEYDIGLVY